MVAQDIEGFKEDLLRIISKGNDLGERQQLLSRFSSYGIKNKSLASSIMQDVLEEHRIKDKKEEHHENEPISAPPEKARNRWVSDDTIIRKNTDNDRTP